jgi:hypothetical protein
MAQDRYGQFGGDWRDRGQGDYGQRGWSESDREGGFRRGEDFRRGEEGRTFGPGRSFQPGEDRDAWGADDRRGAGARERDFGGGRRRGGEFGRDDFRGRERGAYADDRGEGRREFGRGPGRYDQAYRGPDVSGPWEGGFEERRFRADHRGHGPKGYRRSDERIREDVSDHLTDDPFLDARNIEVEVRSCEVILNGSVDSREDKRRAELIADQVSGVENVQNNLRAQPSPGQGLRQQA